MAVVACELLGGKPCWREQQRKEGFCGVKDTGHYSPNQALCHVAAHHAETNGLEVYPHAYRVVYFRDSKGTEAEFREGKWPGKSLPPKKEPVKTPIAPPPPATAFPTHPASYPPKQEQATSPVSKKSKKNSLSSAWEKHIKPSISKNAKIIGSKTASSLDQAARHYVPKSILGLRKKVEQPAATPIVRPMEQRPTFPTIPFDSGAVIVTGQTQNIKAFLKTKMNAAGGLDTSHTLATALVANKQEFEQLDQLSEVFGHRISSYQVEADNPILRVAIPNPGEPYSILFIEDLTEVFQPEFDEKTRDHIIQLLWSQKTQANPSLLVIATINTDNPHFTDEMRNYIRSLIREDKKINL